MVLSVVAIAIEVLCFIGITELSKRKHYISALLGIPFLGLAIITTVSFELGKFTQASSDSIASRQYEADGFNDNRKALTDLRKKRDHALAKGWTKSAAKYQTGIDKLKTWTKGTTVSETNPRAAVITRYTGANSFLINDGFAGLLILFLLMGRTILPYWTYLLCTRSDQTVSEPEFSTVQTLEQSCEHSSKGSISGTKSMSQPKLKLVHCSENSPVLEDKKQAVRTFLNKHTVPSNGSVISATLLFEAFQAEQLNSRLPKVSQCWFGRVLKELGHTSKARCKNTGRVQYQNIKWKQGAPASVAA